MKEDLIEKKVKIVMDNLNAILDECAKNDISIAIDVIRHSTGFNDTIYIHKSNKTEFKLREIYR